MAAHHLPAESGFPFDNVSLCPLWTPGGLPDTPPGCVQPCGLITLQAGLSQALAGVTVRLPAGLRLAHTSELCFEETA